MAGIFKTRGISSKHEKLADKWSDYRHSDKVSEGVTYLVKYLGSTLVTELTEEGQSYGDHISSEAIDVIISMAKASNKKQPMMSLNISPRGIKVVNTETNEVYSDLDIYRICFCTADRVHGKVFAYIARNKDNETMECHAFLCPKKKIAEAVTLTVAESFRLAEADEQRQMEQKRLEREQQQLQHQQVQQQQQQQQRQVQQQQQLQQEKRVQQQQQLVPATNAASTTVGLGFEDNFVDMRLSSNNTSGQHTSACTAAVVNRTGSTSNSQDLLLL